MIEDAILERLRPSDPERQRIGDAVTSVEAAIQTALEELGAPGRASVQGSMAKDTWLAGGADVDLFILFPLTASAEDIASWTEKAARRVLEGAKHRYAQHPYVVGQYAGLDIDVVPAYAVPDASEKMSAVDRTPFHTAWVASNLDAQMRDEVRLTKKWCKGVEVYGAETSIGGFSGYLVEVLIGILGSFQDFLSWLIAGAQPRVLSAGDNHVTDLAPVVVVDPVDPSRNCAAALTEPTLRRAIEAAKAYRAAPDERFFFPAAPGTASTEALRAGLEAAGATWIGLEIPDAAQRLDIVYPQFQKAQQRIADAMTKVGFRVRRGDTWTDDAFVGVQWVLDDALLPAQRRHDGPPADTPHAERYRSKWEGHPDAPEGVQVENGRLFVVVHEPHRAPFAWLEAHLGKMPLGKHVEAARGRIRLLDDPGAVDPLWSPAVTDFVLDRRPWQR